MDKTFIYSVDGKDYQVNIIYKRIRNIHYRFQNGAFLITCPKRVSEKMIKSGLEKYARRLINTSPVNKGETADSITIFGEVYPLSESGLFSLPNQEVVRYKNKEDLHKKLKKWFLNYLNERNRYYGHLMNAPEYTVKARNMRTRYGTNNKHAQTITYALVLMHYSIEIIDSVIVHELTHCFVYNHSDNFYRLLYKYCPNYDILRKKLIKAEFK